MHRNTQNHYAIESPPPLKTEPRTLKPAKYHFMKYPQQKALSKTHKPSAITYQIMIPYQCPSLVRPFCAYMTALGPPQFADTNSSPGHRTMHSDNQDHCNIIHFLAHASLSWWQFILLHRAGTHHGDLSGVGCKGT